MTEINGLYYGPPDADHFCAFQYPVPGRRCPNWVDFHVKVPDGRGDDWRKAWAACVGHLAHVIWQMQLSYGAPYGGDYLLRAAPPGKEDSGDQERPDPS